MQYVWSTVHGAWLSPKADDYTYDIDCAGVFMPHEVQALQEQDKTDDITAVPKAIALAVGRPLTNAVRRTHKADAIIQVLREQITRQTEILSKCTGGTYERIGVFTTHHIFARVALDDEFAEIMEHKVKAQSLRYHVFKHSCRCVTCDVEGIYFALERVAHPGGEEAKKPDRPYHLNLYALDDNGGEVMMTKDHIIPIAEGGARYDVENMQTMCTKCNAAKGAEMPD